MTKPKPIRNTPEEELAIQRGIDAAPDNPEVTAEEVAKMVPHAEFVKRQRGRPKLENPKERVTLYVDAEVVSEFRASGDGWQTRMNNVLRDWVVAHKEHA
jgi:uncharacterized protein (DUF4415 family)